MEDLGLADVRDAADVEPGGGVVGAAGAFVESALVFGGPPAVVTRSRGNDTCYDLAIFFDGEERTNEGDA